MSGVHSNACASAVCSFSHAMKKQLQQKLMWIVNSFTFLQSAVSSDHMSPRPPFPPTEDEFLIADFMRGASYTKYIYCLVFLSVLWLLKKGFWEFNQDKLPLLFSTKALCRLCRLSSRICLVIQHKSTLLHEDVTIYILLHSSPQYVYTLSCC